MCVVLRLIYPFCVDTIEINRFHRISLDWAVVLDYPRDGVFRVVCRHCPYSSRTTASLEEKGEVMGETEMAS